MQKREETQQRFLMLHVCEHAETQKHKSYENSSKFVFSRSMRRDHWCPADKISRADGNMDDHRHWCDVFLVGGGVVRRLP